MFCARFHFHSSANVTIALSLLFTFKAQLCGIRFQQEANHELGGNRCTKYTRIIRTQAAHVNCPAPRNATHSKLLLLNLHIRAERVN